MGVYNPCALTDSNKLAILPAVLDALAPLRVNVDRMRLSPERLLWLIEEAKASTGAA